MKKILVILILLNNIAFAENTWDSNFKFNGQKWDATSTNHIKESIIRDREFKRDTASKESIHFILETQKCVPHSSSGQVGKHEFTSIKIKVKSDKQNPLMLKNKAQGDPYLHWVKPAKFFYWKCFSPQVEFSDGVLAYPFQCSD